MSKLLESIENISHVYHESEPAFAIASAFFAVSGTFGNAKKIDFQTIKILISISF